MRFASFTTCSLSFNFINGISTIIMSDIDELRPEDSVSNLSHAHSLSASQRTFSTPSYTLRPVPSGIKVVNRCKVVVNTPECLSKLSPLLAKVACHYHAMYVND